MKRIMFILVGLIAVFSIGAYIFTISSDNKVSRPSSRVKTETSQDEFEERKAAFAIYTNGTFRIFTHSRYHKLSEDVYLTADSPNIVTVAKQGVTWKDFFESLPMKVTKDCLTTGTGQVFCTNETQTLKFYLNGQRDDEALEKEIMDGDRLLISYGNENFEVITSQMEEIPQPN